jgi:hypothetical protein
MIGRYESQSFVEEDEKVLKFVKRSRWRVAKLMVKLFSVKVWFEGGALSLRYHNNKKAKVTGMTLTGFS